MRGIICYYYPYNKWNCNIEKRKENLFQVQNLCIRLKFQEPKFLYVKNHLNRPEATNISHPIGKTFFYSKNYRVDEICRYKVSVLGINTPVIGKILPDG